LVASLRRGQSTFDASTAGTNAAADEVSMYIEQLGRDSKRWFS
jgi:hypothetical protein